MNCPIVFFSELKDVHVCYRDLDDFLITLCLFFTCSLIILYIYMYDRAPFCFVRAPVCFQLTWMCS